MTVLAELDADFPWGVLLITDASSTEQIPDWSSPEEMVTAAQSALVVRVRNADEGSVAVRVLDAEPGTGQMVFEGALQVTSGSIRVSDATGGSAVDVPAPLGSLRLRLFADDVSEATAVDVVIGSTSGSWHEASRRVMAATRYL